ncbi:DUF397 domain-containing protein [Streptomyces shenzhenensis]|uniref:DUF397 domain-containing protein n=1 Tax=Streptomyces shenzhenensis TaxID=943815 RepID=UPI003D8D3709
MPKKAMVRAADLEGARFFKSSYSGSDQSTCVEVADARQQVGRIAVRDSKNTEGPVILFAPDQFAAFINDVRA